MMGVEVYVVVFVGRFAVYFVGEFVFGFYK